MVPATLPAVKLFYTRWLFWADGMTLAPTLVLIHPRARGDAGLLAHELVHCAQMRRTGTLRFWCLYACSRRFRLAAELEAYRRSLQHRGASLDGIARALARGYLLGISVQQARRLLLAGPASARL